MPSRTFDLRVDAGVSAGRTIEPLDQLDLLAQRRNAKGPCSGWKSVGKNGAETVCTAPFPGSERLYFGQVEVARVVPSVGAFPFRKPLCNVGYAIEMNVVQDDKLIIARGNDVLLDIVRAESVRVRLRFQGMVWKTATTTPMKTTGPHRGWRKMESSRRVQTGGSGGW